MKVFLTDLPEEALDVIVPASAENYIASAAEKRVHPCIGCMRCLLNKPGACAIADRFTETVEAITECSELVLFTECFFGSVSPAVKAALDRLFPFFQGEMELREEKAEFSHCIPRPKKMTFWFYGTEDPTLRKLARDYVAKLANGWGIEEIEMHFVAMAEDLMEAYGGGAA